jgi:hypothetical protein
MPPFEMMPGAAINLGESSLLTELNLPIMHVIVFGRGESWRVCGEECYIINIDGASDNC